MNEIGTFISDLDLPWDEPQAWWLAHSQCEVLVAESPGHGVLGFCMLGWGSLCDADVAGEICEHYVEPAHRGLGIGLLLLNAALERLPVQAGLQVFAANEPALSFWRRALDKLCIRHSTHRCEVDSIPVVRFRFRPLAAGGSDSFYSAASGDTRD